MKQHLLLLYILSFSFILTNCFDGQITSILTEKVASNGMLILNTTGFNYEVKNLHFIRPSKFRLTIKNEKTSVETRLDCFFYKFYINYRLPARILCITENIEEGIYSVNPITETTPYDHSTYNINFLPSIIKGTFQVQSGREIYFYNFNERKTINFYTPYDCERIEFSLFQSYKLEDTIIYFDDIPIKCYLNEIKMYCPIKAEQFPQIHYKAYTLTLANRKTNYFVLETYIRLNYIKGDYEK